MRLFVIFFLGISVFLFDLNIASKADDNRSLSSDNNITEIPMRPDESASLPKPRYSTDFPTTWRKRNCYSEYSKVTWINKIDLAFSYAFRPDIADDVNIYYAYYRERLELSLVNDVFERKGQFNIFGMFFESGVSNELAVSWLTADYLRRGAFGWSDITRDERFNNVKMGYIFTEPYSELGVDPDFQIIYRSQVREGVSYGDISVRECLHKVHQYIIRQYIARVK